MSVRRQMSPDVVVSCKSESNNMRTALKDTQNDHAIYVYDLLRSRSTEGTTWWINKIDRSIDDANNCFSFTLLGWFHNFSLRWCIEEGFRWDKEASLVWQWRWKPWQKRILLMGNCRGWTEEGPTLRSKKYFVRASCLNAALCSENQYFSELKY